MLDENKFVCPKCLRIFKDDYGGEYPRGNEVEVYCPDCETPISGNVQTKWWLEMDEGNFTISFLKERGFDFSVLNKEKITSCYHWLWCYLERFIEDKKTEVDIWTSHEAKQAYGIINELWEKPVKGLDG